MFPSSSTTLDSNDLSSWLEERVVDAPTASRWPLKRKDLLSLKAKELVTLIHDWRYWSNSPRYKCEVVSPPVAEITSLQQCRITLQLRDLQTGLPLTLYFLQLCSSTPDLSPNLLSPLVLRDDSPASGDSCHVFSASSATTSSSLLATSANSFDPTNHGWLLPSALHVRPAPSLTVRSRFMGTGAPPEYFSAVVPDEVWSVSQLAPHDVHQLRAQRRSVRDRGSRNTSLFFVLIYTSFPRLVDLCRERLYQDPGLLGPLGAAATGLSGQLWNAKVCGYLNRITSQFGTSLRGSGSGRLKGISSASRDVERLPGERGPIALFVDETSPTCGRATCGNAAFEWEAEERHSTRDGNGEERLKDAEHLPCHVKRISCSCGNQKLEIPPQSMVRCEWYRVNSPPLHKLDAGYWSFARCIIPNQRGKNSEPISCVQLCYTGTWITGQNTTDVWIPE